MIRLPDMVIGAPGAIPAAFSLSTIQLPLPTDLHPRTNDNRVNYFDTGIAKLRINCNGGTHGNAYLEAVLTKIANNTQYLVTVVSSIGTWPSISARQIGRNMAVPYAVSLAGAGQPIRDIRAIGDNLIDDPVENGYWLALAFDWTSVSGGVKNGYYTVELESSAYG